MTDRHKTPAALRTPLLGVEIVVNHRGTFINVFKWNTPHRCIGPLEGNMTMTEALLYLATEMRMEASDEYALR